MNHFFDVGAFKGTTLTDFLSKTSDYDGWTVWCFEPSPRHLAELIETAKQFIDRYKIKICPFGIAAWMGPHIFYEKDDPMGDSFEESLASDHPTNNLNPGYQLLAPCLSLGYLCRYHLQEQDRIVVKLDCEGSEYGILESLSHYTPPQITKIFVEWHTIGTPHDTPENLIKRQKVPVEQWLL